MSLRADQRDYKQAFTKHLHAYNNWGSTGSDSSKRLILAYCVECGLKCAIMKQEHLNMVSEAQVPVSDALNSHDFRKMLKILKQVGVYTFPRIKTTYLQYVEPHNYHEFCRYCIKPENECMGAVRQYDEILEAIAKWIKEHI